MAQICNFQAYLFSSGSIYDWFKNSNMGGVIFIIFGSSATRRCTTTPVLFRVSVCVCVCLFAYNVKDF